LRKRCGRLTDYCGALQCIAVHCGASSARCGGVHHILNPLTIMAEHCRKACIPLQRLRTIAVHCGVLQCIAVQVAHPLAECITHSRKRHNSIYVPYDPAERRLLQRSSEMQTLDFYPYSVLAVVCNVVCRPLISNPKQGDLQPPKLPPSAWGTSTPT